MGEWWRDAVGRYQRLLADRRSLRAQDVGDDVVVLATAPAGLTVPAAAAWRREKEV